MTAKIIMVQGTASHVGKSIIVAALCRIFKQDGYSVAPFKAQNMASGYTLADGGEIGGVQAVQAEAAGVQPSVDMNPILLKPVGDSRSEIVVLGKPYATMPAVDYYAVKDEMWRCVVDALNRLAGKHDVIVIEGAGGCAEINLSDREIVNMRVALHAKAPVLLVGDIERGGVFASLVGTMELLTTAERSMVKAFIVNKFRGDIDILNPGLRQLEDRTGVPVAGVLPWFNDIYFPEEDSLGRERVRPDGMAGMAEYDRLADTVRNSLDMDLIYDIAGLKRSVR